MFNTFPDIDSHILTPLQQITFENIVAKGELPIITHFDTSAAEDK